MTPADLSQDELRAIAADALAVHKAWNEPPIVFVEMQNRLQFLFATIRQIKEAHDGKKD